MGFKPNYSEEIRRDTSCPLKEVHQEDITVLHRRRQELACSGNFRINVVKMTARPKATFRFNVISVQCNASHKLGKYLISIWKHRKSKTAKTILNNNLKKINWRYHHHIFQVSRQHCSAKNNTVLA